MNDLIYKSYCWSFGTTSFRTKNFNKTIETQLILIDEFWKLPGYSDMSWEDNVLQKEYYMFLQKKGFLQGDAVIKDKDAREKTSGLVNIGLLDNARKLTEVAKKLLDIVKKDDIGVEKYMCIPYDSYIYLKQLLKFGVGIEGKYVRPFVVIIYLLCELKYLSFDEFTYLIPLIVDKDSLNNIVDLIKKYRNNEISIDQIIINNLMSMSNYQSALEYFLENKISKELFSVIGLNRKSRQYDIVYYDLYQSIYDKYIM